MKNSKGFTLLEVMISIAILAVMMTLIWSSSSQSLRTKDMTEKRDLVYHSGRMALRKVSDDLRVAFLAKAEAPKATAEIPEVPIELAHDTFMIGEDDGGQDSVRFTSLSHLRLFKNSRESDQCKIQYSIKQSEGDPSILNLVRQEDPWLDGSVDLKGRSLVFVEDVREFNIEYYDNRKREWVKEWDTRKVDWRLRLPFAVRINIVFRDPDDEDVEISMSTAVVLALSKNPIEM